MKKNNNMIHKILLSIIALLSAVLLILLIPAGYRLIKDKIQEQEWKVRNQEVQSELEGAQLKLQELSSDSQALQEFLEQTQSSAKKKEQEQMKAEEKEPEPSTRESSTPEADTPDANTQEVNTPDANTQEVNTPEMNTPEVNTQDVQGNETGAASSSDQPVASDAEAVETMGRVEGDAILIDEPEPVPVPKPEESISNNAAPAKLDETDWVESVSQNAIKVEEGLKLLDSVSQNAVPKTETIDLNEAAETVSQNIVKPSENEETQETVSENAVVPEMTDEMTETVSGNSVVSEEAPENTETVSGNGEQIADGQAIPFRYVGDQVTLEERRAHKSSFEETVEANEADQQVIASNTIDFSGLTAACLGDSLTAADGSGSADEADDQSYPAILKERLQLTEVYNLGIGGSSIGRYWDQPFVERYTEIPEDTDIILVMGGTNDGFAASAKELGSLEERKKRTFYGDTDELMRGLKERYPNAEIVFITPPSNVLHDYLMSQREYLLPQIKYVDAIKQLAAEYGIDVIDLYNSNILDTHDGKIITEFMPDGVHGNQAGYQILADHFAAELIGLMNEKKQYEQSRQTENNANAGVSGNAAGTEQPVELPAEQPEKLPAQQQEKIPTQQPEKLPAQQQETPAEQQETPTDPQETQAIVIG